MKLVFGNSYSQAIGLNTEQFRRLKRLLSYSTETPGSFRKGFPSARRYLVDNKGYFPSGLMGRVMTFLDLERIKYDLEDGRKAVKLARVEFKAKWPNKPYKAQEEALQAAWKANRGCLSMPTGTGKSRVIAMLIQAHEMKALIIVPSLEIKKQLAADLEETFGSLRNITIENIDAKALKKPGDYGILIIDEAHHVAAKTYHTLNKTSWANIPHRFFMTATPFRNNTEETLLFEGIAGDVIFQLTYKEAIKQGYIAPVEAYYYECPKRTCEANTWAGVYRERVTENQERNEMVAEIALQLDAMKKSTLVLVKEIKHGQALSELTGFPFVNGQDEESRDYVRQFNEGKVKVLIGTTGVIGEGVDTKPCEFVVIACLGKAKSAFMQQVGRGVRKFPGKESCKVILFKDKSQKFPLRHFNAQAAILKEEYGVDIIKLEQ